MSVSEGQSGAEWLVVGNENRIAGTSDRLSPGLQQKERGVRLTVMKVV